MDDPLEEWAAERERRRPQVGERQSKPLRADQPEHGLHVDPDVPRGVQEWDGYQWVPVGVAEDHQAAAEEAGADAAARAERVPLPSFSKLPPRSAPWRPTERFYRQNP
ncbi:DUF6087 family protein [Streptomyces sp. NPDC049954]|uniref:DUF6087 family protein n=1 Tax=Streptomyces sp. NPDC049954 TaxID=3155779 RepID=UPI003415BA4E